MRLPFTPEQFVEVFRQYNVAVWPAQLALVALAVVAVFLASRAEARSSRYVSLALGLLWLWTGAVYHVAFFSAINRAANAFAVLCFAQAALFIQLGVVRGRLRFARPRGVDGALGTALLLYALVLYPMLGASLGHRYPASPTFGLPCPTTIFTFGLLLWSVRPLPKVVLVGPVLWAATATVAAAQLGMVEDFGLPLAAAIALRRFLLPVSRGDVAATHRQGESRAAV